MTDTMSYLIEAVTPVLIQHEGERLKVYTDSVGIPTIGVGLALMEENAFGKLVQSTYAQSKCARCGVDYAAVLSGEKDLTQDQSRAILSLCVIDVIEDLTHIFPAFLVYTQGRQIALIDMRFNLGPSRFRGFKNMISDILAGNWEGAADQALHSVWAHQVSSRADYDAGLLRVG